MREREKHEKHLILPVCNEESNMKHACYTSSSNKWDSCTLAKNNSNNRDYGKLILKPQLRVILFYTVHVHVQSALDMRGGIEWKFKT